MWEKRLEFFTHNMMKDITFLDESLIYTVCYHCVWLDIKTDNQLRFICRLTAKLDQIDLLHMILKNTAYNFTEKWFLDSDLMKIAISYNSKLCVLAFLKSVYAGHASLANYVSLIDYFIKCVLTDISITAEQKQSFIASVKNGDWLA